MKKVLYSGIFDLFHAGHLGAIKEARKFGDYLIVHVASDNEARCVKGALRPVIPGKERAEMLRACRYVDEVLYRDEYLTDEEAIALTGADVMIRNEGSTDRYNIEVGYIPRFIPESGLDTTGIIRKVQSSSDQVPLSGVNYALVYDGEILLQRRDNILGILNPGRLVIPGGGLEKGENPHIAAGRELKEETGIDLHPKEFRFLTDIRYPDGSTNRAYFVHLKERPNVQSFEGTMEWHKLDDIGEQLAWNQDELIAALKAYNG